jgi:hypothetical protein
MTGRQYSVVNVGDSMEEFFREEWRHKGPMILGINERDVLFVAPIKDELGNSIEVLYRGTPDGIPSRGYLSLSEDLRVGNMRIWSMGNVPSLQDLDDWDIKLNGVGLKDEGS